MVGSIWANTMPLRTREPQSSGFLGLSGSGPKSAIMPVICTTTSTSSNFTVPLAGTVQIRLPRSTFAVGTAAGLVVGVVRTVWAIGRTAAGAKAAAGGCARGRRAQYATASTPRPTATKQASVVFMMLPPQQREKVACVDVFHNISKVAFSCREPRTRRCVLRWSQPWPNTVSSEARPSIGWYNSRKARRPDPMTIQTQEPRTTQSITGTRHSSGPAHLGILHLWGGPSERPDYSQPRGDRQERFRPIRG